MANNGSRQNNSVVSVVPRGVVMEALAVQEAILLRGSISLDSQEVEGSARSLRTYSAGMVIRVVASADFRGSREVRRVRHERAQER